MKKYLMLFMLMLTVFNYSYSVSKIMPETDWKKKELKGRVKTMVSTRYEYELSGSGKLEKTWVTTTNFNEQGYITKEVQYVNNKLNRSVVYKNNKDGLPIKRIEESLIKNNTEARKTIKSEDKVFSYKYEEAKDGNLLVTIKEENVDERNYPSLEKITYDKNGRKIYYLLYSGGELIIDNTNIYNEKGVLIEVADNLVYQSSIKITYDYKANGDYEIIRETAGARWIYYYDKNGNEKEYLEITNTSSQRKPNQRYFKFEDITRDKYGNLTTRTKVLYDYSQNKEIGITEKIVNKYEYY